MNTRNIETTHRVRTIQKMLDMRVCFVMCSIVVAIVNCQTRGLAFQARPKPSACKPLCNMQLVPLNCKAQCQILQMYKPTKDLCHTKRCRPGSRCKMYGSRPVCIPIPKACLEHVDQGLCLQTYYRYFYNKITGKCEMFVYGGCDGNANHFGSYRHCAWICLNKRE
ncbi:eppin-like [Gigantopelta aegis]|uniref:eppin-like n=1 Tax=Gigantopelta aegis TaxID=1735272 RepID=UPI001B88ADCF|nr:eppin-like [Gigantopelta aegis]